MAFAFVQSATGGAGAELVMPGSVTAGNLVVVWCGWEDSTGTTGLTSVSDGTDTLTLGPVTGNGATSHQQWAWLLVSTAGVKTYTVTLPAGAALYSDFIALEFSYAGTIALDVGDNEGTNIGSGTSLTSGSVTLATTGESELVLCGGHSYTGPNTYSAQQINTVAADGFVNGSLGNQSGSAWYRIVTAAFTGTGTATVTSSDAWGCHIIAFKEASGGATVVTEQEGFRFRNDDGSESGATWKAAQDTNANVQVSQNFRLRFLINKR